jgi:hypothetical protein
MEPFKGIKWQFLVHRNLTAFFPGTTWLFALWGCCYMERNEMCVEVCIRGLLMWHNMWLLSLPACVPTACLVIHIHRSKTVGMEKKQRRHLSCISFFSSLHVGPWQCNLSFFIS